MVYSKRSGKSLFVSLLLATTTTIPTFTQAQQAAATDVQETALDSVVVTARKRVENAAKVPISMSVVSGKSIAEQGIGNLQDLAPSVPNFDFTQTIAAADQYFIRGFGSGVNAGFEMAVGTVVDGFFYGRSRYGRAAFLDIERVEVLKGPQGALIGKNTSAGAINITSSKPTSEFQAYLTPSYEFTGNKGYSVDGAISGPLTPRIRGRVAFSYENKDGWVNNLATGGKEPHTDDFTQRTTLDFDLADNVDAEIFYQYGHMRDPGRNTEISQCSAALQGILQSAGLTGQEDCKFNYTRSAVDIRKGAAQTENHNTTFHTTGLTVNWSRDNFTVTSLTGYSEYKGYDSWDLDFLPIQGQAYDWGEKYHQWSQELRIASNKGEHLDYTAGIFLEKARQNDNQQIDFFPAVLPPALVGSRNYVSSQSTDTAAAFAQVDWHINREWTLTVGGRYTYEKKKLDHQEFPTQIETAIPITLPGGPAAPSHDVHLSRSERNFSPNGSLQWKPNDDTMFYANISRGFKGGGYDLSFNGNQAAALASMEFAGETVTAYELGAKFAFDGNRGQLNIDAFREDFKNLQVSALLDSNNLVFAVGNAAAARSQGVEADFRWRPVAGLTLSASGAYLDAKFTSFPSAQCYLGQTAALGCFGGIQNLAGHPLQFAPKWAGTANIEYVALLGRGYALTTSAQLVYKGSQYLQLNNDPNLTQSAYAKINGRVALSNDASFWTISLIMRNLTNKITSPFGNSATAIGGIGTYYEFIDPPREMLVQVSLKF